VEHPGPDLEGADRRIGQRDELLPESVADRYRREVPGLSERLGQRKAAGERQVADLTGTDGRFDGQVAGKPGIAGGIVGQERLDDGSAGRIVGGDEVGRAAQGE
jgi:hypothetical protein